MKRVFLCLLTLAWAALCAMPALAQDATAYICLPTGKEQERAKRRTPPHASSDSILTA